VQNPKEKVDRAHFAVVIIFISSKLNLTQQPNQRDGFAVRWRPAFGRDRSYAVWEIQHGRCCPVHPRVSRHDHQKITGIRLRQLSKHGGRWAFFFVYIRRTWPRTVRDRFIQAVPWNFVFSEFSPSLSPHSIKTAPNQCHVWFFYR